jgi:hypothetical protein
MRRLSSRLATGIVIAGIATTTVIALTGRVEG